MINRGQTNIIIVTYASGLIELIVVAKIGFKVTTIYIPHGIELHSVSTVYQQDIVFYSRGKTNIYV